MIEEEPLLTVEDHILIEGRGLVVIPILDLPPHDRRFKPFVDKVVIRRPDGTEDHLSVNFAVEHFSLAGGGSKWSIALMLPNETKETVPIGSRLFVSVEARRKLNGEVPNKPDVADG